MHWETVFHKSAPGTYFLCIEMLSSNRKQSFEFLKESIKINICLNSSVNRKLDVMLRLQCEFQLVVSSGINAAMLVDENKDFLSSSFVCPSEIVHFNITTCALEMVENLFIEPFLII